MSSNLEFSKLSASEHKVHKDSEGQSTPPLKIEDVENPGSSRVIDAETEKRLLRKLDIRIIPMVCWIYLMNFMDRVNIGNARLYGLEDDLGLVGNQFQIAVSILFVTYVIFETPSNMVIKRMQPARYLAGLVLLWGLVATFSAFVNNFAALVACRLLLGTFEAGLFPGVILYLSMFYNKRNVSQRQAWFYGTSAISGALGGLVAYVIILPQYLAPLREPYIYKAIGELDGAAGWRGWRWIILINGIPTILTAFVVPFVLPNSPATAHFLNEEDRRNLVLLRELEVGQTKAAQEFHKEDVIKGAKDWKTYAFAIAQFVGLGMLYSFSVFLPTIINDMGAGWSRQVVQALTIPVYFAGFATYVTSAWLSDRTQQRGIYCIGGLSVSLVGYICLIINKGLGLSFAGTFIVALGLWVSTGTAFSWISVNNPRYGKRAFASGMQITIGNISGVAAPFLYSNDYAPTYFPGYGATIGLLALGISIYVSLYLYFRWMNKRKLEGKEDWRIEGKSEEEIAEMGEDNPRYLYTI
ncbi:Nn.00g014500.m01.CDS01 [Neocucurbitaria sp. VM-36]